jgi:ligand-binding sensor domain-containing protein
VKKAFFYSLVLLCPLHLWAQYHSTIQYTSRDGLLSSELFTVLVDRTGRVWTGSGQGVSCFDGNSFQNYTVREGLWQNAVHTILEDREGNIWFGHTEGPEDEFRVSVWRKGYIEIVNIEAQTGLQTGHLFRNPLSGEIQVFGQGQLWTYAPNRKEFRLKATLPDEWRQSNPVSLYPDPYRDRFFVCRLRQDQAYVQEMYIWTDNRLETLPALSSKTHPEVRLFSATPDGRLLLFFNNETHLLRRDGVWRPFSAKRTLDEAPSFPFTEQNAITWEQNDKGEVKLTEVNARYPEGVTLAFRTPHPVSAIDRAPDGTYWVAARGALIRVFPAFWNLTADQSGIAWLSDLHAISEDRRGNIWFGSYTFGFSYFDGERLRRAPPFLNPTLKVLPGALLHRNGYMHFWVEGATTGAYTRGLMTFDGERPPALSMPDTLGYYFHTAQDGQIGLGLNKHGLGILDPQSDCPSCLQIIGPEKGHQLTNVITTVKDRYGRWWMGRPSAGFAYYDPVRDTVFSWLRNDPIRDIGIMSTLMDSRGNLWLGTTHGLRFFQNRERIDPAGFDPQREFKPVALREMGASQVNAMVLYDSNTLIAGNRDGIALIDLVAFYEGGEAGIYFMEQRDGYAGLGTEQNCIWKDSRGRVWIGSDAGAHRFDPRLFVRSEQRPVFALDSLTYGKQFFDLKNYDGRTLRLKRARFSPRLVLHLSPEREAVRPDHLYFSYQLSVDSSFSAPTRISTLEFPNLGPGNYSLWIKALKDGRESEVQTLHFRIPGSIWASPWPYLALLALFGGGFWWYQKIRHIRDLEKNKLRVNAIVNQLNPHFINNALQWVQIRSYQDEETVSVISRLGENIRVVFKNSRQKRAFHLLKEEMQLVENYLYIQKKRFGAHIEYQLPPAALLEKFGEIMVPLMQIQIHCENAVEHGIRNKETPGKVNLRLIDKQDYLHIMVEDDGVGRRRAAELGSRGTQQGVKMLESLMNIFNKHNAFPIRSEYEDDIFSDEQGHGYGTRVHIWIPKNYHYEFD